MAEAMFALQGAAFMPSWPHPQHVAVSRKNTWTHNRFPWSLVVRSGSCKPRMTVGPMGESFFLGLTFAFDLSFATFPKHAETTSVALIVQHTFHLTERTEVVFRLGFVDDLLQIDIINMHKVFILISFHLHRTRRCHSKWPLQNQLLHPIQKGSRFSDMAAGEPTGIHIAYVSAESFRGLLCLDDAAGALGR